MAVTIDTFYSEQYLEGTRPSNPSFPVGSPDPVVNPPGTGGAVADNFVTLDTEQTITGEKTFDATTIIGDPLVDYLVWDKVSKTFSIFTQAQFTHKYRGGASGALNIGQYDVNGNASINNTSNGLLSLGTNNISRVEIEADGDVLLKKVDNALGDFVRIDPTTGQLTKRTTAQVSAEVGGISDAPNDGLSYIRKNLSWVDSKTYDFSSSTTGTANIIDSLGNVTYSTTSASIIVVTHSLINLKIMAVNLFGISSTGSPSGGDLLIQASGDSTFLGLNVDNGKAVITVTRLSGTSYSSADISLFDCEIITTGGIVSLRFKNIATNTRIPAFTSTNAVINIKILSYN